VRRLIAFTGCVAMLTSGLLPAALHLRLKWTQLAGWRRALLVLEGALALALAVLIVLCLPAVGILPSLDTGVPPHLSPHRGATTSTLMLSSHSSNIVSDVSQRSIGPPGMAMAHAMM
jgi:hypothetical protein